MFNKILYNHVFFYGHKVPKSIETKTILNKATPFEDYNELEVAEYKATGLPITLMCSFYKEEQQWYFQEAFVDNYTSYEDVHGELGAAFLLEVFGLINQAVRIDVDPDLTQSEINELKEEYLFFPGTPRLPTHVKHQSKRMLVRWR